MNLPLAAFQTFDWVGPVDVSRRDRWSKRKTQFDASSWSKLPHSPFTPQASRVFSQVSGSFGFVATQASHRLARTRGAIPTDDPARIMPLQIAYTNTLSSFPYNIATMHYSLSFSSMQCSWWWSTFLVTAFPSAFIQSFYSETAVIDFCPENQEMLICGPFNMMMVVVMTTWRKRSYCSIWARWKLKRSGPR